VKEARGEKHKVQWKANSRTQTKKAVKRKTSRRGGGKLERNFKRLAGIRIDQGGGKTFQNGAEKEIKLPLKITKPVGAGKEKKRAAKMGRVGGGRPRETGNPA